LQIYIIFVALFRAGTLSHIISSLVIKPVFLIGGDL
jgi:hypothetical protein